MIKTHSKRETRNVSKDEGAKSLTHTCCSGSDFYRLNRIVHHMHPKISHSLVEGSASVVWLSRVATTPGARRVLDEGLDPSEDQLHALSTTMFVQ